MSVSNLPISEDNQGHGPKKAALCGAKRQKRVRADGEAGTVSLSEQQEHECGATKAYSAIGHAIEVMHRKRYLEKLCYCLKASVQKAVRRQA